MQNKKNKIGDPIRSFRRDKSNRIRNLERLKVERKREKEEIKFC